MSAFLFCSNKRQQNSNHVCISKSEVYEYGELSQSKHTHTHTILHYYHLIVWHTQQLHRIHYASNQSVHIFNQFVLSYVLCHFAGRSSRLLLAHRSFCFWFPSICCSCLSNSKQCLQFNREQSSQRKKKISNVSKSVSSTNSQIRKINRNRLVNTSARARLKRQPKYPFFVCSPKWRVLSRNVYYILTWFSICRLT